MGALKLELRNCKLGLMSGESAIYRASAGKRATETADQLQADEISIRAYAAGKTSLVTFIFQMLLGGTSNCTHALNESLIGSKGLACQCILIDTVP